MVYRPDFENYTIEELLEAQGAVNREKYQERAREIDTLVEKKMSEPAFQEKLKQTIEYRKYSTFFPRFFASIIDGIVLSLISYVLVFIGRNLGLQTFIEYIDFVKVVVYSVALHAVYGQTIGKMTTSVKVVDFNTENKITFKQALLRDCAPVFCIIILLFLSFYIRIYNLTKIPEWLLYIMAILGYIYLIWFILEIVTMLFSKKRRALHDLIAGTVVIRIDYPEQTNLP